MKVASLCWVVILPMLYSSCTEIDLDFRREEGTVIIAPDWSSFACPTAARYCLYTDDGTETEFEKSAEMVAADYLSMTLPVGNYRLLAYNTDVSGVNFTGLENIASAEVCLASDVQPANVYSWNVDDVEVPLRSSVQFAPQPRRLVKQMVLHFQVTGMEEAEILSGKLNGVYPSVSLLTGEPSRASLSAAPDTKTKFSATLTRAATRNTEPAYTAMANVRLFGLLCPENGAYYDCRLNLQVHNSDETYSTTVDMNGVMTEIINLYAGELPVDETVEVHIGINWVDSTLVATVKSWTEGTGEGEI